MTPSPRSLLWDRRRTWGPATISDDDQTLAWQTNNDLGFRFFGSQTKGGLSRHVFTWDFRIDSIVERSIFVGIMLDPPDWRPYGYLGACKNAWSYNAFTGDVVAEEEAMYQGLPTVTDGGLVSVRLDLKVNNECVFVVNGEEALRPFPCRAGAGRHPLQLAFSSKGSPSTLLNFKRIDF